MWQKTKRRVGLVSKLVVDWSSADVISITAVYRYNLFYLADYLRGFFSHFLGSNQIKDVELSRLSGGRTDLSVSCRGLIR